MLVNYQQPRQPGSGSVPQRECALLPDGLHQAVQRGFVVCGGAGALHLGFDDIDGHRRVDGDGACHHTQPEGDKER